MKLDLQRTVETELSLQVLTERLEQWADLTGYSCARSGPPRWEFRRGSWWHSLYSFNIRKWPTRAVVALQSENPIRIHCSVQFRCWWTVVMAEDERRLEDDFETLLAFVCETRLSRWPVVSEEVR